MPILHFDTSDNLHFGNANQGGGTGENEMIFDVQTGKNFEWEVNQVQVAEMQSNGALTFVPSTVATLAHAPLGAPRLRVVVVPTV